MKKNKIALAERQRLNQENYEKRKAESIAKNGERVPRLSAQERKDLINECVFEGIQTAFKKFLTQERK